MVFLNSMTFHDQGAPCVKDIQTRCDSKDALCIYASRSKNPSENITSCRDSNAGGRADRKLTLAVSSSAAAVT